MAFIGRLMAGGAAAGGGGWGGAASGGGRGVLEGWGWEKRKGSRVKAAGNSEFANNRKTNSRKKGTRKQAI